MYVGNDDPGPQRIRACSPGEAEETACGILGIKGLRNVERTWRERNRFVHVLLCFSVAVLTLVCLGEAHKKIRVVCRKGDCSQSHNAAG